MLKTECDRVYEPLLNLDLLGNPERGQWTQQNIFAPQPYLKFGVNTDEYLRPLKGGNVIEDLYAAGAILGGYDSLAEGCGVGVSLLSVLFVAEQIVAEWIISEQTALRRKTMMFPKGSGRIYSTRLKRVVSIW